MRLLVVFACATALAGFEVRGTTFADTWSSTGATLVVRGGDRLTWGWFWDIYDAALYLPPGFAGDPLEDAAKRYEVVYRRHFSATDCRTATDKTFGRGLSTFSVSDRAAINALYVDVGPGDRFAYTYVPGIGTTLSVNGRDLGTVPGPAAAKALFAIWIGPMAVDEDLKAALLRAPQ